MMWLGQLNNTEILHSAEPGLPLAHVLLLIHLCACVNVRGRSEP